MDNIVVVGSSGHAKVIIDIVEAEGRFRIVGLLDRFRKCGERMGGYQVLGQEEDLEQLALSYNLRGAIIAIGDNFVRSDVASRLKEVCPTISFVCARHPKATIAKGVPVGEGSVIMAGATVNPCSSVGRFCIVNTNSSLDHDSVMEDFASLGPGATTGGNCRIGNGSAVGIGAVLIHGVHVGQHAVLGAGSTAINDIVPFCVAYGTPAKFVRGRKAGDSYL